MQNFYIACGYWARWRPPAPEPPFYTKTIYASRWECVIKLNLSRNRLFKDAKEWVIYVPIGCATYCTAAWVSVNSLWVGVYSMWVLVLVVVHVYSPCHTEACVFPLLAGLSWKNTCRIQHIYIYLLFIYRSTNNLFTYIAAFHTWKWSFWYRPR